MRGVQVRGMRAKVKRVYAGAVVCVGVVLGVGVEPTRANAHWILNPARLPISPPERVRGILSEPAVRGKFFSGGGAGCRGAGGV